MRTTRTLAILVGAAAILAAFYFLRVVLLPFVVGVFLAYLISPLVSHLESQGMRRTAGMWLVFGSVGLGAVLTVWLLLPLVGRELSQVMQRASQQAAAGQPVGILGWLQSAFGPPGAPTPVPGPAAAPGSPATGLPVGATGAPAGVGLLTGYLQSHGLTDPWLAYARQLDSELQRWLEQWLRRLLRAGVSAVTTGYALIFAPFIAYYLVRDWQILPQRLERWLPAGLRPAARQLGGRLGQVVVGFVRGQLLVSALVGAATAAAMLLLHVPYAFTIGLLGGVFEMVPYVGPFIAGIPAVLAASVISPWTTLGVIVAFVLIHQVESTVIEPRIMGEVTGLHPLVVLGAVLIGEELLGVLGMLLAVPTAAISRVLLEFWLRPPEAASPAQEGR